MLNKLIALTTLNLMTDAIIIHPYYPSEHFFSALDNTGNILTIWVFF